MAYFSRSNRGSNRRYNAPWGAKYGRAKVIVVRAKRRKSRRAKKSNGLLGLGILGIL